MSAPIAPQPAHPPPPNIAPLDESVQQLKADLVALPPRLVLSKWMLDRVPHVFHGDAIQHITWKDSTSRLLGIDSHAIVIVGSAGVGHSFNPAHPLSSFSADSDIDIAVISQHYFDAGWHWLRTLGPAFHGLPPAARRAVEDHRTRLIYWGALATDRLLPHMPFGTEWLQAQGNIASRAPMIDREINFRVYRDSSALVDYQVNGLVMIRDTILGSGATP